MKPFKYVGTVTGRFSSYQPNVSFSRKPTHPPLFIPDPKPVIIEVDFCAWDEDPLRIVIKKP